MTDIGGGYAMQQYTVDNSVEVFMVHRDGRVYALGISLPEGSTLDDFSSASSSYGYELAMILYAAATPGINEDNLFTYANTISQMTDDSFTAAIQAALTNSIPTSGMVGGSTTTLMGNTLSTHLDLSLPGDGVDFSIVYAPSVYNF